MSATDISRHLSQPEKRYSGVRMQQGRVILDSDFNEMGSIDDTQERRTLIEVICAKGTPNDGFLAGDVTSATRDVSVDQADGSTVTQTVETYDFPLAAGSFYLGGTRFEAPSAPQEQFLDQSDWIRIDAETANLPARPLDPADLTDPNGNVQDRVDLVYLRGWEQCVTAVEDSELRERALGGPDTSIRLRRMRRIEVLSDVPGTCAEAFAALQAELTQPRPDDTSGVPHDIDAATCALLSKARLTVSLGGGDITEDPCKPRVTQGFLGAENQTIRVELTATNRFIWGTNNAAPFYRVTVEEEEGELVRINFQTPPRDQTLHPLQGQAVEIIPWSAILPNQEKVAELQGHLATVVTSYDPETASLTLAQPVPRSWLDWITAPEHDGFISDRDPSERARYFYLRLWTGGSGVADEPDIAFQPGTAQALPGTGLEVTFSDFGLAGDHWIIAARPNTPDEVVPWSLFDAEPPAGTTFYFAPLALVRWTVEGQDVVSSIQDCRSIFRPLCEVGGCCTITVGDRQQSFGDVSSIQLAINLLPPSGGEVCVLPGTYEEHVVVEGRQNVTIHGCGPRSRMVPQPGNGDPLLLIRDSQRITVRTLGLASDIGTAVRLEGTAPGQDSDLAHVRLEELEIAGRDRSAVLGQGGHHIALLHSRISIAPLAAPLEPASLVGFEPAVFLAADDMLVEGNQIVTTEGRRFLNTALGGLQIGGGSDRVEIRRNLIRNGTGNGITLGSIDFVPAQVANDFNALTNHYQARFAGPTAGPSIRIRDDGCPEIDPNPTPPTGDDGEPLEPVSDGALTLVRIVDNDIQSMGSNGIAVVRLFVLGRNPELITTDRLTIEHNRIVGCMRLEIGLIPPELREIAAFGGIILADGEYFIIRGNTIEANGTAFQDPICGIFILHGEGITIDGNRVLRNGRRGELDQPPRPGLRGGVVVALARPRTVLVSPFGDLIDFAGFRQDGVPAFRMHDNIVAQPEGRAVKVLGIGPMSVEANQLSANGGFSLGRTPLPGVAAGTTTNLNISSAAAVPFASRKQTSSPLTAFLDVLGGAVVSMVNLGVSNETLLQLFGFSGLGIIDASPPGQRDDNNGRLFVGGNILFNDNQVVLDAFGSAITFTLSSVLLITFDDISMNGNQSDCDLVLDFVVTNALTLAPSLRVADNRFKEPLPIGTFERALLSAITFGLMNATTDNQGTHCFFTVGVPQWSFMAENRHLVPGSDCEAIEALAGTLSEILGGIFSDD